MSFLFSLNDLLLIRELKQDSTSSSSVNAGSIPFITSSGSVVVLSFPSYSFMRTFSSIVGYQHWTDETHAEDVVVRYHQMFFYYTWPFRHLYGY